MKNDSYPEIRFKGFNDAWEQRKLGELGTTYTGISGKTSSDFGHGDARFITYMNVYSNAIANPLMVEPIEIDQKQNEVKVGDVFFTTSSETPDEVGMSSVLLEKQGTVYLNSFCFGYRPKEKIDLHYLAFMLRSEVVRKNIIFLAQGISRYNISKNKMMEISVPLPTIEEQSKIGNFLNNLANLITLHQRKYEKLKNIKQSMLEKMFPKNGEKFPEIRFKGFTDAWEQRKLGEVLSFLKDGTHGTHADANDGPLLLSAKNIKDGAIKWDESDRRISREEYEKIHAKFSLMPGDVLLTIVGSIGETAILKDVEGLTFQRSVAFLRPNNEISSEFLYSEIQTPAFQKELDSRKSTSAQPGIYLGDLAEIPINYSPSLEEQKKIGEYFRHLDNLITLHQRKLEKLKITTASQNKISKRIINFYINFWSR